MRPHIRCSLFGFGAIGVVNSASGSSAIALRRRSPNWGRDAGRKVMDCHEIGEGSDTDRRLRRPGRIPSAMGATVRTRLAKGTAHRRTARGHAGPRRNGSHAAGIPSLGPVRRLTPASIPQHEDGQQPTIPEPAGMNRERWEALVFKRLQARSQARQVYQRIGPRGHADGSGFASSHLTPVTQASDLRRTPTRPGGSGRSSAGRVCIGTVRSGLPPAQTSPYKAGSTCARAVPAR